MGTHAYFLVGYVVIFLWYDGRESYFLTTIVFNTRKNNFSNTEYFTELKNYLESQHIYILFNSSVKWRSEKEIGKV